MRTRALLLVMAVFGLPAGICHASPIITNPSFETGDLTGWDALPPDHMKVVEGAASDGNHYLTADIQWSYLDFGYPVPPCWHWQSGCWQRTSMSRGMNRMSVDVRTVGLGYEAGDSGHWTIEISGDDSTGTVMLVDLPWNALETEACANGFTRYSFNIPPVYDYDLVRISIIASGDADTVPDVPIEFSVDNFQVVPEPTIMLMLVVGTSLFRCKSRT